MKRLFDIFLAVVLCIFFAVPMLLISLVIVRRSGGGVLYWSSRVGRNNAIFDMPKFRTMKSDTPTVASHLLEDRSQYYLPTGAFLRYTSLDELPQLYSILRGDMSFVGPRPALSSQNDLIEQRNENGLAALLPGLTGWAQVNGRDSISISEKVALDVEYSRRKGFLFDLQIIFITFVKVITRESISQ